MCCKHGIQPFTIPAPGCISPATMITLLFVCKAFLSLLPTCSKNWNKCQNVKKKESQGKTSVACECKCALIASVHFHWRFRTFVMKCSYNRWNLIRHKKSQEIIIVQSEHNCSISFVQGFVECTHLRASDSSIGRTEKSPVPVTIS